MMVSSVAYDQTVTKGSLIDCSWKLSDHKLHCLSLHNLLRNFDSIT